MTGRLLPVLLAALITTILAAACGGDDDEDKTPLDYLGTTAETATYAYADGGAAALYDYVARSVTEACTKEEFVADLAGAEQPTGFRGMEDAEIKGDKATATVVQIFDTEDRGVRWSFVDEGDNAWRITMVPEMDECAPQ